MCLVGSVPGSVDTSGEYVNLAKGEYVNLAWSIICLSLEDNISLPMRYSYLSIFPDHNADIFYSSLLVSYCSFSSIILSSIVMISFYILSKRFSFLWKVLSIGEYENLACSIILLWLHSNISSPVGN